MVLDNARYFLLIMDFLVSCMQRTPDAACFNLGHSVQITVQPAKWLCPWLVEQSHAHYKQDISQSWPHPDQLRVGEESSPCRYPVSGR